MLSSVNNIMWQTQHIMHKQPQVVPGTLLSIAGCLLVHRHTTTEIYGHDHVKTFLALIIIQMLPLVALEMKIMSCADPVGLFCKFATPVTLVHAIFLSMRVCMSHIYEGSYVFCSTLGLAAALITLIKGFRESPLSLIKRGDVWALISVAMAAAFATCYMDRIFNASPYMQVWSVFDIAFVDEMLSTSNSYIELMAFIPAVWMVYNQDQRTYDDTDRVTTKRKATAFFLFLVSFYAMEDLLQAYETFSNSFAGCCAHVLHFVLLCDFAFYVLAHIYNTDKLVGQLRKWLPADLACEV